MNEREMKALHDKCSENRELLTQAPRAACFYCRSRFHPSTITEWIGLRARALCPICGIDSVLPDTDAEPITDAMLVDMNRYWFSDC